MLARSRAQFKSNIPQMYQPNNDIPRPHFHFPRLPFMFPSFCLPTHNNLSSPSQILQRSPRIPSTHTTDPQSPNLRPPPQPLQANRDLPALLLRDNEDVALAFLISNTGAQHMQSRALVLARLPRTISVRTLDRGTSSAVQIRSRS